MSRVPVAAFVALAIATVAAFFITQHLKVTTPLLSGAPAPHPAAIDPLTGGVCELPSGPHGVPAPTSFRRMRISFDLLKRADDVDVKIIDSGDHVVATLASHRHLGRGVRTVFYWGGRFAGGQLAPSGDYYVQVRLIHQHRTVRISNQNTGHIEPVRVEDAPAAIRVTGVRAGGSEPAVLPQADGRPAVVHFTRTARTPPTVRIYRTDLGPPQLVDSFASHNLAHGFWDGTLADGRAAPQGTYLVGLSARDHACAATRFPSTLPPAPGSTAHAGVTVRYLVAAPPLSAVAPGARASVAVDARGERYEWALRPAGSRRIVAHGVSAARTLSVPVPAAGDGLYALALRDPGHRTVVPIVAGSASLPSVPHGRVLVVLPALTWQGLNPVDDNGDGLPDTLSAGQPIALARPLLDGLPAELADEAGLVRFLAVARLPFTLTTDLSLISDQGASLRRVPGIVLAGSERWLPAGIGSDLSTYVEHGGHVLSFGIGALQRSVTVSGQTASDPSAAHAVDDLLARPEPLRRSGGALVFVDRDRLHLFSGSSQTLAGFRAYQPFGPLLAPARLLSAAGVAPGSPAVIGYALGRGDVVDVGLPGFGSRLVRDPDAQGLVTRTWRLLER